MLDTAALPDQGETQEIDPTPRSRSAEENGWHTERPAYYPPELAPEHAPRRVTPRPPVTPAAPWVPQLAEINQQAQQRQLRDRLWSAFHTLTVFGLAVGVIVAVLVAYPSPPNPTQDLRIHQQPPTQSQPEVKAAEPSIVKRHQPTDAPTKVADPVSTQVATQSHRVAVSRETTDPTPAAADSATSQQAAQGQVALDPEPTPTPAETTAASAAPVPPALPAPTEEPCPEGLVRVNGLCAPPLP